MTGQAYILLQHDGNNSVILVAGANHSGWFHQPHTQKNENTSIGADIPVQRLHQMFVQCFEERSIDLIMLQREIPESVNILVASIAKERKISVFLVCISYSFFIDAICS